jgi:hypothetical protein
MKSVATYLVGMCGFLAVPVHATSITNNLMVSGMVSISDPVTVNTFGPTASSNYVSDFAWIPALTDGQGNINASTNSSYAYAWGNAQGRYLAHASGFGKFSSYASFQNTLTLTNTNSYATDYSVNIYLGPGSLGAYSDEQSGSGFAKYDLEIRRNGGEILFASMASIDSNNTLTTSGVLLNDALQTAHQYDWGGTELSLDLGELGIGESLSIDLKLVTSAFADFGFTTTDEYGNYRTGQASASLGESFTKDENALPGSLGFVGVVEARHTIPLPGSLALVGIGIAGLGFSKRRLQR